MIHPIAQGHFSKPMLHLNCCVVEKFLVTYNHYMQRGEISPLSCIWVNSGFLETP
jgi:hypothetical protein